MAQLLKDHTARSWTLDKAGALAKLFNDYTRITRGREAVDVESLESQMQLPGIQLATDTCLIENGVGELVGAAFAIDFAPPHVVVTSTAIVRHDEQGRGFGTYLADWVEKRAQKAIEKAPPEARVVVMQTIDDRESRARALLASRGYEVCRHFWRMEITLGATGSVPSWPDGIRVVAFDPSCDVEDLYHANKEAFEDHWGHVQSSDTGGLDRLKHRIETDPDFDPTLWFLARDHEEIAGVCRVSPCEGPDRTVGYVQTLGVRRRWRKQGIGLALLHHAFGELRARRFERVALHVDSDSPTGATRLYEKAGMRVSELSLTHELELRSGVDLTKR